MTFEVLEVVAVETKGRRSPLFGVGVVLLLSKDVAPIFFARCAECHRAGEMPPWKADHDRGKF